MSEVRVIIIYTDKLESISVDGIKMSDISPIQNLAIQDWFSVSNGRDGWRGLIQEIRELVDDENVSLNFEFQGPEESKSIFEKCIKKLGYGTNGLSKKEIAKRNMDEAVRAEHRGLYNKAFKCYVNAADFGDSIDAKYMVAEYYYDCYKGKENGVGVDRKDALAKAIEYYEESANAGYVKSQRRLYELYSSGDGVKEDGNEVLKWLIKMAENDDDPDVLLKIGDIYNYGKYGININKANAFFWYEKSANQGNTDAMCELGEFYFNGYGVQKNQSKAFDWDKKAAELGNSRGQYRVGCDYEKGVGVFSNYAEAFRWYEKSANQGNMDAMCKLGIFYSNGYGIAKNLTKAFEWDKKAAELGSSWGQYRVAYDYETGVGVSRDYAEAFRWYEKSANQGNTDAMCKLGSAYLNGYGIQKNRSKAFYWDKKAAELGSSQGQYQIGYDYETGIGTSQNYEEAFKWYEKSANQGNADATCALGTLYLEGLGVEKDLGKAFYWGRKAADLGSGSAQTLIGAFYENGVGVETNNDQAVECYRKAIENGCAYAIYRLGQCYEKGLGVEKDLDKARQWYKKGADQEPGEVNCCLRMGDYYFSLFQEADSSWDVRTSVLVGLSVAIPITNWVTIPTALLGSFMRHRGKKKKFLKSEAGQEMIKYYQKAAGLGNEDAKELLEKIIS